MPTDAVPGAATGAHAAGEPDDPIRAPADAGDDDVTAPPPGLKPGGRFGAWDRPRVDYVVIDLDGTLVGPSGEPTTAVVEAVAAAERGGVVVGIATGRMRLAAEPVIGQLGLDGPHILHNGAEVRDASGTVEAWPLTREQIGTVLRLCRDLDVYAEIYVDEGYLVSGWDERARPHWELMGREPLGLARTPADVPGRVFKATYALFGGRDPDPLIGALDSGGLKAGPAHSPVTPGIGYVNATRADAHKGRALTRAAEHLGLDLTAAAALGDAPNDLPMLEIAGTAVAMADAPEPVRAVSHLIAPPATEDGVATALEALLGAQSLPGTL